MSLKTKQGRRLTRRARRLTGWRIQWMQEEYLEKLSNESRRRYALMAGIVVITPRQTITASRKFLHQMHASEDARWPQ